MEFLNRSWLELSKYGQNKLLKTSYFWLLFVPLVARLLQSLPDELQIPIFEESINLHLNLPFSWKIFFFAALAFSAAEFIFTSRCPQIIREYKSLEDYKAEGRTSGQVLWFLDWASTNEGIDVKERRADTNRFSGPLYPVGEQTSETQLGDLFHSVRFHVKFYGRKWRLLCTLLFYIGFILSMVLAIQNVSFVIHCVMEDFGYRD